MTVNVNMQAPNGLVGQQFVSGVPGTSGTTYTVPANGIVTGVNATDAEQMAKFGFRALPQAGSGAATMNVTGNLYSQANLATSLSPTTTGADYVLAVYSIPANTFDGLGNNQRVVTVDARGLLGASTANKRLKMYFNPSAAVVGSTPSGGTLVADTGTCTGSGLGWQLKMEVMKAGAPNSNTQIAQAVVQTVNVAGGSVVQQVGLASFPTATENAAILVCVTGYAGTTAATDVNMNTFIVTQQN